MTDTVHAIHADQTQNLLPSHAFKHIWPLLVEQGPAALSLPQVARHALTAAYQPFLTARGSGALVVGQLGQSLDGRIATPSGASRDISGFAALDHLHRIRALVDAVVVGVGTVVADDPRLTTRRAAGPNPARVLIDPRGRSSRAANWLRDDDVARIVFSDTDAPWPAGVRQIRSPDNDGIFPPQMIVAALAGLGYRRLLIEGGANTLSRFLDAGAINRLHITVAPMIIGSGRTGLDLQPIDRLSEAKRPQVHLHLLDDGNVLYDCDMDA